MADLLNRTDRDDNAADAEIGGVDRRSRLRRPLLLATPVVIGIALLYFYLTGG